MKGGEGENAHRATVFCSLAGIIGGILRFRRGKVPLTGLDKTLVCAMDFHRSKKKNIYRCYLVRINVLFVTYITDGLTSDFATANCV
jgi:hypothetical protein